MSQIADADRKISTLYDMLDEQDATNRDNKGLPFTASVIALLAQLMPYGPTDPDRLYRRPQESYPPDDFLPRFHGQEL